MKFVERFTTFILPRIYKNFFIYKFFLSKKDLRVKNYFFFLHDTVLLKLVRVLTKTCEGHINAHRESIQGMLFSRKRNSIVVRYKDNCAQPASTGRRASRS
ncbi:hypothetical protein PUN28_006431 [Cardiocondyla obscurior]|uniref:Uncharacterized protein n=1 Tax=Cardiocondyla obscurior TaxID=286306 RepID=A0AAW2GDF2_9HYME